MKFALAQMRTQKRLVIVAWHKTNFLTVDLIRHFQSERASDFAYLRLRHRTQRRQRASQLFLSQAKEKIRLVLAWIDTFAQHRAIVAVFDDRVMPGGDVIAVERFRFVPEIAKLKFLIAHHARI